MDEKSGIELLPVGDLPKNRDHPYKKTIRRHMFHPSKANDDQFISPIAPTSSTSVNSQTLELPQIDTIRLNTVKTLASRIDGSECNDESSTDRVLEMLEIDRSDEAIAHADTLYSSFVAQEASESDKEESNELVDSDADVDNMYKICKIYIYDSAGCTEEMKKNVINFRYMEKKQRDYAIDHQLIDFLDRKDEKTIVEEAEKLVQFWFDELGKVTLVLHTKDEYLYSVIVKRFDPDVLDAELIDTNEYYKKEIEILTTDEHISQEDLEKYNLNGKIVLSAGYLQECLEAGGYPDTDQHSGLYPSMIFEAPWPEASEFAGDVIENFPPPAKIMKTENGSAAAPASNVVPKTAPPPLARKGPSKIESGVMPIAAVTPYCNHIRIHGVVTRKEEMRTIASKNMKIFNFEVTDSLGDCIRITAFNETAESIASTIVENMGYYITGGTVKVANKQYNNTGHDYELTLRSDSKVEQGNASIPVPKLTLKRVELAHIGSHLGNLVDVLVVVEKIDENCTEFVSRNGKELVKRKMDLIDESSAIVRLTLWGNEAKTVAVDDYLHKVVVFKGVTPREFQGNFSLSTGQATRIHLVPEHPAVANLLEWYAYTRPTINVKSLSQFNTGNNDAPRTIAGITEMRFGENSDKGDYASLKAKITRINPANALYKGCSNEGCQKKVVESDGDYRCEKCQTTNRSFKWLYMLQFEIADETGQVYVTAFGDTAAKIVGKTADEVGQLKETDESLYNETFEKLLFHPKLWRVRCKIETCNEEARQRLTVFSVDEINHDSYICYLEQFVEFFEKME